MVKFLKIIIIFILSLGLFINYVIINTSALGVSDNSIIYKAGWLNEWIELVKTSIKDIDTEWKASDKIQDIIQFLLWFLTLIAIIYIIYAWFRILTSSGEDEVVTKSKKTIFYVIIWILVIWFAYTIANFAVEIWTSI